MSGPILVLGATGTQGNGVVRAIINRTSDIAIHALVRDPNSQASQALAALGPRVKIFEGNFEDVASIQRAAEGCVAAFLNVTPVFTDMTGEARHAKNQMEGCKSTLSIKRVVYSSSSAMDPSNERAFTEYVPQNPTSWMSYYMKSKKECEDAVTSATSSELPDGWCIIRGATFFTNFLPPHVHFMHQKFAVDQTVETALAPDLRISHLDPNDLSQVAAQILLSDDATWQASWMGKAVPIAKENYTFRQIIDAANAALNKAGTQKQLKLVEVSGAEAKERATRGDILIDSQLYLNKYLHPYDLQKIKSQGVDVDGMLGVEEFFEQNIAKLLEAVGGK